jgi:hypothetical protein
MFEMSSGQACSRYHRLPIAEKRREAIARIREPAISCPQCDTQVMPDDLLAHLEQRCPGRRDPGPGARWVAWNEALALGVNRQTLSRWTRSGQVRFIGERQDRRYLLRDLALKIAQQRGFRRR